MAINCDKSSIVNRCDLVVYAIGQNELKIKLLILCESGILQLFKATKGANDEKRK